MGALMRGTGFAVRMPYETTVERSQRSSEG